jgi:hypothetical protein
MFSSTWPKERVFLEIIRLFIDAKQTQFLLMLSLGSTGVHV